MNKEIKFSINLALSIIAFMQIFGNEKIIEPKILYVIGVLNNLIIQ